MAEGSNCGHAVVEGLEPGGEYVGAVEGFRRGDSGRREALSERGVCALFQHHWNPAAQ